MDEISKKRGENETPKAYRNRVAKHIFKRVKGLHRPEEMHRLEEEMRRRSRLLYSVFAERPDGLELADTLRDLLVDHEIYAHYAGVRRGYLVAQELHKLSKWRPEDEATAAIVHILRTHPNWKVKQIFAALDESEVPLFYRGKINEKNASRWSDVAKEPAYEMYVSRIREKVFELYRVTVWSKIIRKHTKLRRGVLRP